jgi:hypothetical protein
MDCPEKKNSCFGCSIGEKWEDKRGPDLVNVHVHDGNECVWIAFLAVSLYGGADKRLG